MKLTRKLFSALLAVLLLLSLSITAFAKQDDPYKIIVPDNDYQEYLVYQIFTGDVSDNKLTNVKYGKNAKDDGYVLSDGEVLTGKNVRDAILTELESAENGTDAQKLEVITKYVDVSSNHNPYTASTRLHSGKVPSGYYLIKNLSADRDNQVFTTYIVKVIDEDIVINRKGNAPSVDKVIMDPDAMKQNEAAFGEDVNYRITGTLPDNLGDYTTYYYEFSDIMSKGLTFKNGSVQVKVDDQILDPTEYVIAGPSPVTEPEEMDDIYYENMVKYFGGTSLSVKIDNVKKEGGLKVLKESEEDPDSYVTVSAESKIELCYTATLNEHAVLAGDYNPNKVRLIFSNDPYSNKKGQTPESVVKTYVTEVKIMKIDGTKSMFYNNAYYAMPGGVEFTLTGEGLHKVWVTKDFYGAGEHYEDYQYAQLNTGYFVHIGPPPARNADGDPIEEDTMGGLSPDALLDSTRYALERYETLMDGENGSVTSYIGLDGQLTLTGLGAGKYKLSETYTPTGYNTIDDIEFEIVATPDETNHTVTFSLELTGSPSGVGQTSDENKNTFIITVANFKGTTLPETGGIGTTLFYVIGGVLAVGAGILLISKKRMADIA